MWRQSWEQLFYSFIVVGPYVLIYAWSNRFWIRTIAGFICCSQGFSQLVLLLDHHKEDLLYPYLPFGSSSDYFLALCIATGVTGALFAGFSESCGLLLLQAWGTYTFFTFLKVRGEEFDPMRHQSVSSRSVDAMDRNDIKTYIFFGVLAFFFIATLWNAVKPWPPKLMHMVLAALPGAAFGAHALSEVAYYIWGTPPTRCGLHPNCAEIGLNPNGECCPTINGDSLSCCETRVVYGMFMTNRHLWCSEKQSCQEMFGFFIVIVLVSLVAQASLFLTEQELPSHMFLPAHLGDPNCGIKDPYWNTNLRTTRTTWLFLLLVLVGSCIANYVFAGFVRWTDDTAFFLGLVFVITNAYCLWAIIEFFFLTIFFHCMRIIFDIPPLSRKSFSKKGIPASGRTFLSYCLLSQDNESSTECFNTAKEAHLANLDPNGHVSTGVVSVTSKLSVLQHEMEERDRCRQEIREVLEQELTAILGLESLSWSRPTSGAAKEEMYLEELQECLARVSENSKHRARYWLAVLLKAAKANNLKAAAEQAISDAVSHFMYLHRNCKILKKPGQYQDLIVLSSMGSNAAYTYLKKDYGDGGRNEGSPCFGFTGNVVDDRAAPTEPFEQVTAQLQKKVAADISLLEELGSNPKTRYHYTMVLDSDTQCPARSIRQLIEVAEHRSNARHGIINANLAHDFGGNTCTWHMWRSALIEVSKVNLLRGQYAIYDRVGFYGKGLVRNDMYVSRVIGTPAFIVEALPFEILSHDTIEAKLLQPTIAHEVTLYEDIARNPISGFAQSTRWLLGEVRNSSFHDGFYKFVLAGAASTYAHLRKCVPLKRVWSRWREVPCSVGAHYLSLIGFRGFHAGPTVLMINILTTLFGNPALGWGLQLSPGMQLGRSTDVLMFVVITLFIIPNAFMILKKCPSCKLGRRCFGHRSIPSSESEEDLQAYLAAQAVAQSNTSTNATSAGPLLADGPVQDIEANPPLSLERQGSYTPRPSERQVRPETSRGMRAVRLVVLIWLEILSSVLLYGPELIEGCLRLFRAVWAQVTGHQSWTPQDQVEKEVESKLSIFYVLTKTWCVLFCGTMYAVYLVWFHIYAPLNLLLCVTWVLHPFTTYFMCMRVPESVQKRWIWTWIMEEREFINKRYETED